MLIKRVRRAPQGRLGLRGRVTGAGRARLRNATARRRPEIETPPRQHGAHQRRPVLRRPRPFPSTLDAPSAPDRARALLLRRQRRGRRILARSHEGGPPPAWARGRRSFVYKNNSDGKGKLLRHPRELSRRSRRAVRDARPASACRGSSRRQVFHRRPGKSAARTAADTSATS